MKPYVNIVRINFDLRCFISGKMNKFRGSRELLRALIGIRSIGRCNGDITPLESAHKLDSALNLDVAEHIDYEK